MMRRHVKIQLETVLLLAKQVQQSSLSGNRYIYLIQNCDF
jgi:hypothetical protein